VLSPPWAGDDDIRARNKRSTASGVVVGKQNRRGRPVTYSWKGVPVGQAAGRHRCDGTAGARSIRIPWGRGKSDQQVRQTPVVQSGVGTARGAKTTATTHDRQRVRFGPDGLGSEGLPLPPKIWQGRPKAADRAASRFIVGVARRSKHQQHLRRHPLIRGTTAQTGGAPRKPQFVSFLGQLRARRVSASSKKPIGAVKDRRNVGQEKRFGTSRKSSDVVKAAVEVVKRQHPPESRATRTKVTLMGAKVGRGGGRDRLRP